MKGVSKSVIVAVLLLALITAGGIVGWFWTSQQIDDLHNQQSTKVSEIVALEKKTYSPETANLTLLKKSDEELNTLLSEFKTEFELRDKVFDVVRMVAAGGAQRGLEPDEWKKMFGSIRDRMTKEASEAKITIPQDYDFSFSAYRLSLPEAKLTLPLGIQLLGIERLGEILIKSKVQSITAIKRTEVDAVSKGLSVSKDNSDIFGGNILIGPGNLYKVYPFNMVFTCSPEALTEVINKIEASDLVFIIRDISVENEKQAIPLAAQVKAANVPAANTDGTEKKAADKLVIPVLGQELVHVNIRVDLLYLTLDAAGKSEKKPNAKPGK